MINCRRIPTQMGKTIKIFITEEKQSISHALGKFLKACENPKYHFVNPTLPCEIGQPVQKISNT